MAQDKEAHKSNKINVSEKPSWIEAMFVEMWAKKNSQKQN